MIQRLSPVVASVTRLKVGLARFAPPELSRPSLFEVVECHRLSMIRGCHVVANPFMCGRPLKTDAS